ncbi:glycosyltransferase [Parafrankia sp. FMc2]|uniref:glycosyltransferase n=1 Tax=Parafrankia sp. FMc2 TaxID=3233196 RepID=UPI0034D5A322
MVLDLPPGTSFGAAVAAAVTFDKAARRYRGRADETTRAGGEPDRPDVFYWLLGDGVVPGHDALDRLLTYARVDRSAAVLGPGLLAVGGAGTVVEAGVTVDRAGRRVPAAARSAAGPGDAARDVLAVSCSGLLIRAAAWERLGGLAPGMTAGLDLDLGLRAARAGLRVVAVPRATVRVRAGARVAGRGGRASRADRAYRADRVAGVRVRLALTQPVWWPFALLVLVVTGLGRAGGRLARPGQRWRSAAVEVGVVGAVLVGPRELVRMRRRAARTAAVPRRAARHLLPTRRGAISLAGGPSTSSRPSPSPSPLVSARLAVRTATPSRAFVALIALLLVVGGGMARRLAPDAAGGGVPMLADAHDLWSVAWSGWQGSVGGTLGWPGAAPPWMPGLAALAALAAPVGLDAGAVCLALLAVAPAAAACSAYRAAARITASRHLRTGLAALYAMSPPVAGSVIAGRFESAVALAVLPAVLATADEVLRGEVVRGKVLRGEVLRGRPAPRRAGWPAWRLAAGLTVLIACAPALAPVVLVVLPVAFLAVRRGCSGGGGWSGARLPVALFSLVAVLVTASAPLLPGLLAGGPGQWGSGPGPWGPVALMAGSEHSGLVAHASGGEDESTVLFLVVAAGGLLAGLPLRGRGRRSTTAEAGTDPGAAPGSTATPAAGWALAGAGLAGVPLAVILGNAWSGGSASVVATAGPTGVWAGPQYGLACAGLLVAVGLARASARGGSWALRALFVAGTLAFGAVLVAAPLAQPRPVPRDETLTRSVTALARTGGPGARVLVLRGSAPDRAVYTLAADEGPRFPGATSGRASAASAALARLVGDLSAGVPGAAAGLPGFGVNAVVMPAAASDPSLVAALDSVDGLWRDRRGSGVLVWRPVDPVTGRAYPAARARLLPAGASDGSAGAAGHGVPLDGLRPGAAGLSGAVEVPAGAAGRRVVFAETADPGWRATLDGAPLTRALADGWAQSFVLPARGGLLEVGYDHTRHRAVLLAGAGAAGAVLATGLLAAVVRPAHRRRPTPPGGDRDEA